MSKYDKFDQNMVAETIGTIWTAMEGVDKTTKHKFEDNGFGNIDPVTWDLFQQARLKIHSGIADLSMVIGRMNR